MSAVAGGWQIAEPGDHPRGPRARLRRRCCAACSAITRRAGSGYRPAAPGADAAPWAGRPIYGGLRSLGFPGHPLGDLWRAADLVREHRGDSHVISWAVGGADAVEVLLLTEQWWGLPPAPIPRAAAGSDADMDAGFERLAARG